MCKSDLSAQCMDTTLSRSLPAHVCRKTGVLLLHAVRRASKIEWRTIRHGSTICEKGEQHAQLGFNDFAGSHGFAGSFFNSLA